MARKANKPEGFEAFDALARKLVQVPKAEVDRRMKRAKARKAKNKK
jgi:hypothetical protein